MSDAAIDIEYFQARVIADALQHAEVSYWLRRAHQLQLALSRPGDFIGTDTTKAEITRRDMRIRADLARIEAHITLLRENNITIPIEVFEAIREAA